MLEINKFINSNPDWEEKLAGPPYFIKAKYKDNFVLLKYNQIASDFNLPIVRECRGIILDSDDNFRPVCVPFYKFGNFGESYVPAIDWASARVLEKLDGSLIKLWHYKGNWHVSSNGEIDARGASINSVLWENPQADVTALSNGEGLPGKHNLYNLFMEAWKKTGVKFDTLDTGFTYMFELTSPHNRVIVRHMETAAWHIGTRNNETLLECEMDIGVPKPMVFPLGTLDECVESAKQLGCDEEGYVVVDRFYNRIKVKSPRYVALNHMAQGVTTRGNIVEIIQKNEQEEFLTYFPEYRAVFDEVLMRMKAFTERQTVALAALQQQTFDSRKALAEAVMQTECPACLFNLIDKKAANAKEWLMTRLASKVVQMLGFND